MLWRGRLQRHLIDTTEIHDVSLQPKVLAAVTPKEQDINTC
jgi:hypothetical protein